MAFMSQENKKRKEAALKTIIPKSWRWSLAVDHHSTLVLTIWEAPVDLIAAINKRASETYRPEFFAARVRENHAQVNHYVLSNQFEGATLELFEKIKAACMEGNHDRSDIQSDYFDVGWYFQIDIGRWNKPFVVKQPATASA